MAHDFGLDGFPNLAINSTASAICITADPNLYHLNKVLLTSSGYDFDAHIQDGIDNPAESGSGCCCIERDSYKCFEQFYHTVIVASQGYGESPSSISCQRLKSLDLESYRGSIDTKFIKDILVQTRRNVSGFRFSPKCSRAERRKIFSSVENALIKMYPDGPYLTRLDDISLEQKRNLQGSESFLEKPNAQSMCSRSGGVRDWPDGRGILLIPQSPITVWVNEEDHIRIFSRSVGESVDIVDALDKVSQFEIHLEVALALCDGCYMHDSHFGYLTTDPTKLGVMDVRLTMEVVAERSTEIVTLLGQLCDRFQVNFNPAPDSNSPSNQDIDRKGFEFSLSTRPNVFTPEDIRIGYLLECITSIILLDEQIALHGATAAHHILSDILSSPIQYHEIKASPPLSVAPFFASVMSPLDWIRKKPRQQTDSIDESPTLSAHEVSTDEKKPRTWSLCCSPDAMDVTDVSDPLLSQQSGEFSSMSRKRRMTEEDIEGDSDMEQFLLHHRDRDSGIEGEAQTQTEDSNSLTKRASPSTGGSAVTERIESRSSNTIPDPITPSKSDLLQGVTDFPFFPRGCKSLPCKYLTLEYYENNQYIRTSMSNSSLSDIILPGTENSELFIGILAADEECYDVFRELFDPIIRSLHGFTPGLTVQLRDMQSIKLRDISDIDMSYCTGATVRACRNISGYPLAMRISRSDRRRVEKLLAGILEKLMGPLRGKYYPLNMLSLDQIKQLNQRNIDVGKPASDTALSISGCNRDWPDGRGVFISDSLQFVALVNHSDHLIAIACEHGTDSGDVISVFDHWSVAVMLIEGLLNSTPCPFGADNHTHRLGLKEGDSEGSHEDANTHASTGHPHRQVVMEGGTEGGANMHANAGVNTHSDRSVSASVMCGFQCTDRLGYIACSPEDLGTGLHASITVNIPHLGAVQDSLDTICDTLGLRAVSVQPVEYSSSEVSNLNDMESENMRERRSYQESVDKNQMVNDVLHYQTGETINSAMNGVTDTSDIRCWYSRPAPLTVYEISNKRCMGRSEVQLIQDVIHGVAVLLKIEKHVEKGFSVDDYLSKHPLLLSTALPASRSYSSIHDMLQM